MTSMIGFLKKNIAVRMHRIFINNFFRQGTRFCFSYNKSVAFIPDNDCMYLHADNNT